jgi:hypothetical protein
MKLQLVRLRHNDFSAVYTVPRVNHTLVETAAARIMQYIDQGGDWTMLQELPSHLIKTVLSAKPPPPYKRAA